MATIKKGSTGAEVKELQRLLNLAGANLVVDGDFGSKTLEAVLSFQREHGLDPDGIVGPKTWVKLKAYDNPVIVSVNECVRDIQAMPSFKKFMELIENG